MSDLIAITGMGLICPLSKIDDDMDLNVVFDRFLDGQSAVTCNIDSVTKCKIAAKIEQSPIQELFPDLKLGRYGRFIHHALVATHRALKHAGVLDDCVYDKRRIAVIVGSGIGGIEQVYEASIRLHEDKRINPFFVPSCLINMAPNVISIEFGFKGPSIGMVTACATGAHAIIQACQALKEGDVDMVIAGGAEASICNVCVAGFDAMSALCAQFNDSPEKGSRPYDKNRCGFVMGEGAGIVVLERESDALKRRANIHAVIAGYGASADADHITSPNFEGAVLAINNALKMANIDRVGHINAHATSTPVGDVSELAAFKSVFGERLLEIPIAATKSQIGHLLGAAGSVEAILSVLAAQRGMIPGILNLEEIDEQAYVNEKQIAVSAERQEIRGDFAKYALSTSFGFGGTNAAIVLKV